MKRNVLLTIVSVGIMLIFSVCGEKPGDNDNSLPKKETPVATQNTASQLDANNEGVIIAKEILDTFDKAVAESVEIVKSKPEATVLKPKLEALYKTYEEKMKEINIRYLALKNKDIRLFGAANGYLGDNRGSHVFKKDNALSEYVAYYNFQKGDMATVKLISTDIVKMLDIAVQL